MSNSYNTLFDSVNINTAELAVQHLCSDLGFNEDVESRIVNDLGEDYLFTDLTEPTLEKIDEALIKSGYDLMGRSGFQRFFEGRLRESQQTHEELERSLDYNWRDTVEDGILKSRLEEYLKFAWWEREPLNEDPIAIPEIENFGYPKFQIKVPFGIGDDLFDLFEEIKEEEFDKFFRACRIVDELKIFEVNNPDLDFYGSVLDLRIEQLLLDSQIRNDLERIGKPNETIKDVVRDYVSEVFNDSCHFGNKDLRDYVADLFVNKLDKIVSGDIHESCAKEALEFLNGVLKVIKELRQQDKKIASTMDAYTFLSGEKVGICEVWISLKKIVTGKGDFECMKRLCSKGFRFEDKESEPDQSLYIFTGCRETSIIGPSGRPMVLYRYYPDEVPVNEIIDFLKEVYK